VFEGVEYKHIDKYYDFITSDVEKLYTVVKSLYLKDLFAKNMPTITYTNIFTKIDEIKQYISETDLDMSHIVETIDKIEFSNSVDQLKKEVRIIKTNKEKLIDLLRQNMVYIIPIGLNKLFQPITGIKMYGMQLPHQFNRFLLFETMKFLKEQNIYSIVDLHDCKNETNLINPGIKYGIGCNPFDEDCEMEMWNLAIKKPLEKENNNYANTAKYYSIPYKDMEAGSYEAWEKISRLPKITDDGNNFVIHCLAGAGRTGSVMLYLLLRDKYDILKKPDGTKFNLAYFQEQIDKPY
jgi:hypothetical protein